MRAHRIVLFAALILITLSILIAPVPASDVLEAGVSGPVPGNQTPFYTAAARGTSAPFSSFEKQDEVTIFRFELNQTTFPGPRSMAFGPRYIQLTTTPAALTVICSVVFGVSVVVYVLCKRKKAGDVESVCTIEKEEAKENRENGD